MAEVASGGRVLRAWRAVSTGAWAHIDRDGRPADAPGFDRGVLAILVISAFALTFTWYLGNGDHYKGWFPYRGEGSELAWLVRGYGWQALVAVAACVVMPVAVAACLPGSRAADQLRAAGAVLADVRVWLALGAGVACAMFYKPALDPVGSGAWLQWAAIQLALEVALVVLLFGYVLTTLRPVFGPTGVFVALIPFVMFHYGRNWGEVFGALAISLVLVVSELRRPLGRNATRVGPPLDKKVVAVLLVVAISLTAQEYLGNHDLFEKIYPQTADNQKYWQLWGFLWWSGWRVLGYVVLPAILIAFVPGVRVRDQHLSFKGFWKHLWVYAALFAAVFPAVVIASTTKSFLHTYPFYKLANRSSLDLWSWEAMYAAQFLSLEFFFRGVMLSTLRRLAGSNAVFVMIVPYCMIHYGKPMPETLGAIGAGLILGTLAMRTRSIWGGVLIHVGVAISMDVLAIGHCPPSGHGQCGG
ncbi:MAG: CPBP family intramembrane metalloprotease [Deltaproteobacteria bacterium]|nr:CPBP family intramembrane metalloprotease [Deltaproteobacteria bacterium]